MLPLYGELQENSYHERPSQSTKIKGGFLNQEDSGVLVSCCIYFKQLSLCYLFLGLEGLWVMQLISPWTHVPIGLLGSEETL